MKLMTMQNNTAVSSYSILGDDGTRMCGGAQTYHTIHLGGALVPAAFIGGVGTEPEYRRGGLVRALFAEMAAECDRRGVPVTVLHPFSFAYYHRFGFERVADHRVLEFPTDKLDHLPRCSSLRRAGKDDRATLAALYNAFAEGRNLLPVRGEGYPFPVEDGCRTYISEDEAGRADGYITYEKEEYFSVNRMVSVNLHVREMVFLSPAALDRLLGFLRMFEGEMDTVKIHNCAMAPEIELRLCHFMHTSITVIPDLMARIHDVAAVLEAVRYPDEAGHFTVKCYEPEGTPWAAFAAKTTGVFRVDYADGRGKVTRLSDGADYDFAASVPALTRLIFGYESGDYALSRYTPGTEWRNPAPDFHRAFPRRPGGVFEHF